MLKTGGMKWKISIERNTPVRDGVGQPIESWERIGLKRWAGLAPVNGNERFISDQFIASQQVEFTVRYTQDIAAISPLDRIVYPATEDTPVASQIYDILAVHEVGWRESLRIITARRAET